MIHNYKPTYISVFAIFWRKKVHDLFGRLVCSNDVSGLEVCLARTVELRLVALAAAAAAATATAVPVQAFAVWRDVVEAVTASR